MRLPTCSNVAAPAKNRPPTSRVHRLRGTLSSLLCLLSGMLSWPAGALEPVPDKLVVLTFDDSVKSHFTVVRPLLKEMGFSATFFITEGFGFATNKQDYMSWEEIAQLHKDGFEIGNHTVSHLSINAQTLGRLRLELDGITQRCREHGIPAPTSFSWPGNALHPGAFPILKEAGITLARRGGAPEHPYEWGRGFAFEPGKDHPLWIPSAGDARPDWTLADFKRAADQARDGRIAVLQFHGVPDRDHPWVHTDPKLFRLCLAYLKENHFKVAALRDLAAYLQVQNAPTNPEAIIQSRMASRTERMLEAKVVDSVTQKPIPARVYVRGLAPHGWHFVKSSSLGGFAVKYDRQSGFSTNSVEKHTSVSAHPWRAELAAGAYEVRIECGKEYFPETRSVTIGATPVALEIPMRRWIDMAAEGWYSGDTHNHRAAAEIGPSLLAEHLNVALPMVDWTTSSEISPALSPQSDATPREARPVQIDPTHVWYPRNSEYEIFRTGTKQHTLGAMLIVNHKRRFEQPVFPLRAIAAQARAEGGLIDMEKHNWNWSLLLPPLVGIDLFELANNHHWQTQFGVRNWAMPGAAWMKLPDAGTGIDTELGWTHYGFQSYYALLNCGFKIMPAAGTANGVHPVPLGFSRVYVQLEGQFQYDAWIAGLRAGRSFVTTGPMLTAQLDGQGPGHRFALSNAGAAALSGKVRSEQRLDSVEVLYNGEIVQSITPQNTRSSNGSFETELRLNLGLKRSGWIALRCFEHRDHGRFRFAHTAPWWIDIEGAPARPKKVEVEWIVQRVQEEVSRSEALLPEEGKKEYRAALEFYRRLLATAEP